MSRWRIVLRTARHVPDGRVQLCRLLPGFGFVTPWWAAVLREATRAVGIVVVIDFRVDAPVVYRGCQGTGVDGVSVSTHWVRVVT